MGRRRVDLDAIRRVLLDTDRAAAAAWIVRIMLILTAVPAPHEALEATVRFALLPMLDADG